MSNGNIYETAKIAAGDPEGQALQRSKEAFANVAQYEKQASIIEHLNEIIGNAQSAAGEGSFLSGIFGSAVLGPIFSAALTAIPGVGPLLGTSLAGGIGAYTGSTAAETARLKKTDWDKNIKKFIKDNKGTKLANVAEDALNQMKSTLKSATGTGAIIDAVTGAIFPTGIKDAVTGEVVKKKTFKELFEGSLGFGKGKNWLFGKEGLLGGFTHGSEKGLVKSGWKGVTKGWESMIDEFEQITKETGEKGFLEGATKERWEDELVKKLGLTTEQPWGTAAVPKVITPDWWKKTKPLETAGKKFGDWWDETKPFETASQKSLDFLKSIGSVKQDVPGPLQNQMSKMFAGNEKLIASLQKFAVDKPWRSSLLRGVSPTFIKQGYTFEKDVSPIEYLIQPFSRPQFRNPYGSIGGY